MADKSDTPEPGKRHKTTETGAAPSKKSKREAKTLSDVPITIDESLAKEPEPVTPAADRVERQKDSGIQNILRNRAKTRDEQEKPRQEKRKRGESKTMIDQPIPVLERVSEEPVGPSFEPTGEPAKPTSENRGAPPLSALITSGERAEREQPDQRADRPPSRTMVDYSVLDLIGQPLTGDDSKAIPEPASPTATESPDESSHPGPHGAHPAPATNDLNTAPYTLAGSSFESEQTTVSGAAEQLQTQGSPGDYSWIPSLEGESQQVQDTPPQEVRPPGISKTRLDHEVLWEAVEKSAAVHELKVSQEIKERASQLPKEEKPIVDFKLASNCPWSWDDPEPKERVRSCGKCQMQVYNLAGMEMPQAEALIFQRENRKDFKLFKRNDGKFSTADCPVEKKRRQDFLLVVVGSIIFAVCVIAVMMLMPQQPKPQAATTIHTDLQDHSPTPDSQVRSLRPEPEVRSLTPDSSQNSKHPRRFKKDGTLDTSDDTNPAASPYSQPNSQNSPNSINSAPPPAPASNDNADQYWQYPQGHGQYSTTPTYDSQSQSR